MSVNSVRVGVVVIGRNEGERLKRCLNSIQGRPVVYVDSGSTDDSVAFARSVNAVCVELDMSQPFTAARARNMGFKVLLEHHPELEWVMFVDGDCEIQSDWIETALSTAENKPKVVAVCGRRRERYPENSFYNLMCDIEWNTPIGVAKACGGDALYRVNAFREVHGFDDAFIAGEEPELCFRLRQRGYEILRIDAEMTLHDAAMTSFRQWWKRTERSGHAYLLSYLKHGSVNHERFNAREIRSILTWSGIFASLLLAALLFKSLLPLLFMALITASQAAKMALALPRIKREYGKSATFCYSLFVMIGKIPQAIGIAKAYHISRSGRQHQLVEYK